LFINQLPHQIILNFFTVLFYICQELFFSTDTTCKINIQVSQTNFYVNS